MTLVVTYLGMFVTVINQTIVATTMPAVVDDIGGLSYYTWVFAAYMLPITVTLPIYGKLSDVYGRRPFFVLGLLAFSAGALVCALADSMAPLIAGRAIQGLGAGGLLLVAVASVGDLVEPHVRGKWHAIPGVLFAIAAVVGPLVGGVLADNGLWRLAFLVPVPLAIVALVAGARTIPTDHRPGGPPIDYLGAALLVGGLSSLVLVATVGGTADAFWTAETAALAAISAAMLGALLVWEASVEHPLLPVRVLRRPTVLLANGALFTAGVSLFCGTLFAPLAWQTVVGGSAAGSALVLVPMMLAFGGASLVAGYVTTRVGKVGVLLTLGPPLIAIGYLTLATLGPGSAPIKAILAVTAVGTGIGLIFQTLLLVVQNGAEPADLGAATSSAQFSRQLGGALGISVAGAVLNIGLPSGSAGVGQVTSRAGDAAAALSPTVFAHALHPVFILLAVIALAPLAATRRASGSYAESHRAALSDAL